MRQVRRKTVDTAAREYLLKAKNEGLQLSWNKYEAMLPQDGFSQLGLSCHECLQGPCRLNPFRPEETSTVCGLGKEELSLGWLTRQAGKNNNLVVAAFNMLTELKKKVQTEDIELNLLQAKGAKWSIGGEEASILVSGLFHKYYELTYSHVQGGQDRLCHLLALGAQQINLLAFNADLAEVLYGKSESNSRLVGLALLKEKAVNVCLEGTTPSVQAKALELMNELEEEAIQRGAIDGINVVLAGDFSSNFAFDTVSNEGTVEFAILTGLVDLYFVGDSLGRGRIPAKSYHTVVASGDITQEELKELFLQGIAAYAKRDRAKIKVSDQVEKATVVNNLAPLKIKRLLDEDLISGIYVFGGGSNLKLTEDEAGLEIVRSLSHKNALCLAYGNTAVSLAKYGCLDPEDTGNRVLAAALDVEEAPFVYSVGGESDAGQVLEILRVTGTEKAVAVFPELTSARDLQMSLALAEMGVKVFTGVQLPVAGSDEVAEMISRVIEYCAPKELADKIMGFFEGPSPSVEVAEDTLAQG